MNPKYIYGVVRAGEKVPDGAEGLAGEPVELVSDGDLAALASDLPAGHLEAGREELLTHSRVLEEATRRGVIVLPMQFGVVMPDEDAVRRELLGPHGQQLDQQLAAMEGKVEINLKAILDEQQVLGEIVAENREVAALRESIQGKPQDATYFERVQLGELISQALDAKRAEVGPAIVDALEPHAEDVSVGEPVHERMALNASFLVADDQREEFDRAVDALGEAGGGRLRFKYTGPLPPHSFVELGVGG